MKPIYQLGVSVLLPPGSEPDDTFINGQLVEEGFARAKAFPPNVKFKEYFASLEADARQSRRGLWAACEVGGSAPARSSARSKSVVAGAASAAASRPAAGVGRPSSSPSPPLANPGDSKNCTDFGSYEEAKAWFDTYFELYGDVAKLDGNSNGIPCESLRRSSTARGAA